MEVNDSKGGGEGSRRPCFLNTIWILQGWLLIPCPPMGMKPEIKEGKNCWALNEESPTLTRVHTIGELEHSS